MAMKQSYVRAHSSRVWIGGCDGTLGGAGKGEPSVVKPRDLVMTLEAVMRTQVPMKIASPQVTLRGDTLIYIKSSLILKAFHELIIFLSN